MSDLRKKLFDIQQELKVPKDLKNDFAGFKYRSNELILEKVKPLLKKHNLVLTQSDEMVNIGSHNYVKAQAWLRSADGTEEDGIFTSAYAREEEQLKGQIAAQITGGASSYARKYALNGLFGIDDSRDPDAGDSEASLQTKPPVKIKKKATNDLATTKQRDLIAKKLEEIGIAGNEQIANYLATEWGINGKLTKTDAGEVIESLLATDTPNESFDDMGADKHNA